MFKTGRYCHYNRFITPIPELRVAVNVDARPQAGIA